MFSYRPVHDDCLSCQEYPPSEDVHADLAVVGMRKRADRVEPRPCAGERNGRHFAPAKHWPGKGLLGISYAKQAFAFTVQP